MSRAYAGRIAAVGGIRVKWCVVRSRCCVYLGHVTEAAVFLGVDFVLARASFIVTNRLCKAALVCIPTYDSPYLDESKG